MKRHIVTPAVLPPAALAELKQWLGITTPHDDTPLAALLRTALDLCEGFTGLMPLQAQCEELLPDRTGWQRLSAMPVQAITGAETVAPDGSRTPLQPIDYALDLNADGGGCIRLNNPGSTSRIAVQFNAGMAASWTDLPEALRHGLIRLAAHQHRERENSGTQAAPPASVAALWRPWRRLRLA